MSETVTVTARRWSRGWELWNGDDCWTQVARLDRARQQVVDYLDTVDEDYIHLVDRPTSRYDLPKLIERMKAFEGRCIIQTMFMKGEWEGRSVDNTGDEYVGPWLDALREIGPRLVTIYTLDRETPGKNLLKAPRERLDEIAARVNALGIPTTVSG